MGYWWEKSLVAASVYVTDLRTSERAVRIDRNLDETKSRIRLGPAVPSQYAVSKCENSSACNYGQQGMCLHGLSRCNLSVLPYWFGYELSGNGANQDESVTSGSGETLGYVAAVAGSRAFVHLTTEHPTGSLYIDGKAYARVDDDMLSYAVVLDTAQRGATGPIRILWTVRSTTVPSKFNERVLAIYDTTDVNFSHYHEGVLYANSTHWVDEEVLDETYDAPPGAPPV